ncbi:lipocalin family protein [Roseomonas sp. CAU 1739]|uniref:lipocalin family protein n=1 Tax=Roseomonas sp. CAU 1739 TaxID=3140364 RepID=UPI00325BDAB0
MHARTLAIVGLTATATYWLAEKLRRPPLPKTVGFVDLPRYAGTWHEVARFPNAFQDRPNLRAVAVTATYTPQPDGTIHVLNTCVDAANGGHPITAEGHARSASPGNDRLRVAFLWPFFGDYWIIGLDRDYRWAVVGTPNRRFLWILGREAEMAPANYAEALSIAGREGFDIGRLKRTGHAAPSVAAA